MSLLIRRAEPADVPAMSAVLIAAITELCAADHGSDPEKLAAWTRNKSMEGVAAMLANTDLIMLVAERAGSVVAVGAATRSGDIALNYVAPRARFTGVSKALLAQLESELAGLGLGEARLESTATARQFYADHGWIADGPQAVGRKVNGFPMRKRLN
ncbi:MAG: GNAT family N-acetyltransferase [Devosia sp.]|uniref:GNAT family N-acetyltransferase n=1 Tax=Devosia sp. TaxID=1871048 RepID=UPI0024C5E523|nr:GNAT family N-acetyltransferase [Devosia sp.]UYN98735.1 MAG: GNAT family N-acetyltransferase [Devosia sp.]